MMARIPRPLFAPEVLLATSTAEVTLVPRSEEEFPLHPLYGAKLLWDEEGMPVSGTIVGFLDHAVTWEPMYAVDVDDDDEEPEFFTETEMRVSLKRGR